MEINQMESKKKTGKTKTKSNETKKNKFQNAIKHKLNKQTINQTKRKFWKLTNKWTNKPYDQVDQQDLVAQVDLIWQWIPKKWKRHKNEKKIGIKWTKLVNVKTKKKRKFTRRPFDKSGGKGISIQSCGQTSITFVTFLTLTTTTREKNNENESKSINH